MSQLQRYRVIADRPSRMARFVESMRSYWKGPYTLSSIMAGLFSDAPKSSTGISVSEQTALTYSAFWACVNAISTDVASYPLIHYKRVSGGGKERYTDSKLYRLLHDEPNPEMTSFTMRQMMLAHTLTWGNAYAEIERDVQNRPLYLWPLTPDRVTPKRDRGENIVYEVSKAGGGQPDIIPAADMIHIPGLGFDGLIGYSVVAMARESIGLGLATERFGGTFFGNGATFGGVIAYKGPRPTEMSDKNYREVLEGKHQGVDRAHKLLAIYNDATYTRIGIPPNDAQFLETRLHQVEEMCRWFRMPPHKIQHLLRATNNNIEHQGIEYYTDTTRPWCVRWEQETNRKLIPAPERRIQFFEHMIEGALRGDLPSRYSAYAVGRQWGWLSADDVREKENLNPLPGGIGKVYLLPMNMTPADRIQELIDAQIAAKKQPPTPPASGGNPNGGADPNAVVEKNALAMVETIRAALTETQQRAEAHLARAVQAEADAAHATDDGAALRVEAEVERTAALEVAREVGTLKALLLEASEREAHARAEREAADVATLAARTAEAAALRHAEAVTTDRDAVEVARLAAEVATAEALARAEAERAAAVEDRTAWRVAVDETAAAQQERDRLREELTPAREAHAAAEVQLAEARAALTAAVLERERLDAELAAREVCVHEDAQRLEALANLTDEVAALHGVVDEREASLMTVRDALAALETRTAAETLARTAAETLAQVAEADALAAVLAQRQAEATAASGLAAARFEVEQVTAQLAEAEARVATEAAARATADATALSQRTAVADHDAGMIAALRGLISDAVGRMVRQEVSKARQHRATPETLRRWLASYDVLHEPVCADAVTAALFAHLRWIGSTDDASTLAAEVAKTHLAEFRRRLGAALEAEPQDFSVVLDRVLGVWESTRADEVALVFMQVEIDYARTR